MCDYHDNKFLGVTYSKHPEKNESLGQLFNFNIKCIKYVIRQCKFRGIALISCLSMI